MGLGRDDSLLFSLKNLERMQSDRLERERSAERARRAAEEVARIEAERREEERSRFEERLAQERVARDAERARLETDRAAAMREALLTRARAEVHARSTLEASEATRAHERELEQIRRVHSKRVFTSWVLVLGVALLLVTSVAVVMAARAREMRELVDERSRMVALSREAREHSSTLLETAEGRVQRLTREIEALRSRVPDDVLQGAPATPAAPKPSKRPPPPKAPPGTAASSRCVDDGDPLDGCLPRR
jgi:hypothetical protein